MKKLMLLLWITLLFLSCRASVFADAPIYVSVGHASGYAGERAQVAVSLENNGGVLAMLFNLEYDQTRLKLVAAQDGGLIRGATFSPTYDVYPYIMLWNSAARENFMNDGVLVGLTFEILENAPVGKAQINLSYLQENIYDVNLEDVYIEAQGGSITVMENVATEENNADMANETGRSSYYATPLPTVRSEQAVDNGIESAAAVREIIWTNPFADVVSDAWYYDSIKFVSEEGLMIGTGQTTFSPDGTLTRAMLATILYRIEGQPGTGENIFSDVEAGSWYANGISWAAKNGIVEGIGDSLFVPNNNITREQIAAMFYRYAQFKGIDLSAQGNISVYKDAANVSDWALDAVRWAVGTHLISGRSMDDLVPDGAATRAEMATILARWLNR